MNLHVWERKEIENYILSVESVFRLANASAYSIDDFRQEFFLMLDSLRQETLDSIMDSLSFSKNDRSKGASYYRKQAEEILSTKWSSLEGRISAINGKNLITKVNSWMRNSFQQSCSRTKLIRALKPEDIPDEVKDVIDVLINGTTFNNEYNNTPAGKQ